MTFLAQLAANKVVEDAIGWVSEKGGRLLIVASIIGYIVGLVAIVQPGIPSNCHMFRLELIENKYECGSYLSGEMVQQSFSTLPAWAVSGVFVLVVLAVQRQYRRHRSPTPDSEAAS